MEGGSWRLRPRVRLRQEHNWWRIQGGAGEGDEWQIWGASRKPGKEVCLWAKKQRKEF